MYSLLEALEIIEHTIQNQLSMVEFEDGSGLCFNYCVLSEPDRRFIRLEPNKEVSYDPETGYFVVTDKVIYPKVPEENTVSNNTREHEFLHEEQMLEAANAVDMNHIRS